MSTKLENNNHCYNKAAPDEPIFTLRAQDALAPEIVREWAYRAHILGTPIKKVAEARATADAMENWQIANTKKIPD